MTHRLLLALVLCCMPWCMQAQVEVILHRLHIDSTKVGRKLIKADSAWTEHYLKQKYDTAYLKRPPQPLMIRARMNFSGSSIDVHGSYHDHTIESHLHTPSRITLSLGVAYRGISLAFAINPAKWKGTNHSTEFNFNSYGNRYGFESTYQDNKSYLGWSDIDGVHTEVPSHAVTTRILNLSAYYAFNGRRFSYPAAFSQSYIQRRSAGSWMLAASSTIGRLKGSPGGNLRDFTIQVGNIGVGGGYGYNWVLGRHWLLHVSGLPTIVVGSFNKIIIEGAKQRVPYRFPEFILTGRAAALYQFRDNQFVGLTFVEYHTIHGSSKRLRLIHQKWRLRLTYGIRF